MADSRSHRFPDLAAKASDVMKHGASVVRFRSSTCGTSSSRFAWNGLRPGSDLSAPLYRPDQ